MENVRLKNYLEKLSRDEKFKFAEACGCRLYTLNKIANGTYNPTMYLVFKMSILMGKNPVEILNETYVNCLFELQENGYIKLEGRNVKDLWK